MAALGMNIPAYKKRGMIFKLNARRKNIIGKNLWPLLSNPGEMRREIVWLLSSTGALSP
jgi:hypothetical protein